MEQKSTIQYITYIQLEPQYKTILIQSGSVKRPEDCSLYTQYDTSVKPAATCFSRPPTEHDSYNTAFNIACPSVGKDIQRIPCIQQNPAKLIKAFDTFFGHRF